MITANEAKELTKLSNESDEIPEAVRFYLTWIEGEISKTARLGENYINLTDQQHLSPRERIAFDKAIEIMRKNGFKVSEPWLGEVGRQQHGNYYGCIITW